MSLVSESLWVSFVTQNRTDVITLQNPHAITLASAGAAAKTAAVASKDKALVKPAIGPLVAQRKALLPCVLY